MDKCREAFEKEYDDDIFSGSVKYYPNYDRKTAYISPIKEANFIIYEAGYRKAIEQQNTKERQLHEIREIYAGMEGFIPETAPGS